MRWGSGNVLFLPQPSWETEAHEEFCRELRGQRTECFIGRNLLFPVFSGQDTGDIDGLIPGLA